MIELPSGTVSLLFSDIEGSTTLLSRLGPAYAHALDGQRQVLRRAWAEHGGRELGTEGDSFYVVFTTAQAALAAAAQAQGELARYPWPDGEQVRVRIGVHTGSPRVHDGAYVGMDVHRAARIAGAAHGGQVLLSEATAKLSAGCLPPGAGLRDLGSHLLKDLPTPERLFQLSIDGLQAEFPPVRTLGAASSLPTPGSPLVGRDAELAELTSLLGSPGVRLVTLTGPGGSGKTRLAIALAQRLVERFPDGVYFVPLASVGDADVTWTSIAEVLDVPTDARQPPRLLDHVAHRNALFVLDNLEQIEDADTVVSELLDHASETVIVATTRKPLALDAEYVHPVPPLQLPDVATLAEAEASEAVQLFVQQARKATPTFRLTSGNAADVVEVCRRLDGLPLAIELAAARVRLLSPAALLRRLDHALDLTATGRHRPARQQTLRETIAWSYDLLDPTQQALFRCLGVFAGGADLEAISDVAMEWIDDQDPLDVVASLVDASLARISEGFDGEPRVHLLTTVRAFALEQLAAAGELADVQRRHAEFYLTLAEFIGSQFVLAGKALSVRERLETEQGNFREALSWAFLSATDPPDAEHVKVGLRLAAALSFFWFVYGYLVECRRWLEQGIEAAAGVTGPEVAAAMLRVGWFMDSSTESEQITMLWSRALTMSRRLGTPMLVAEALRLLASLQGEEGDIAAARALLDEAIAMAAEGGDSWQDALTQCWIFVDLANLELRSGSPEVAGRYSAKVRDLALRHGIEAEALRAELDIAWALALAGRGLEALAHLNHHSQPVINNGIPLITVELVWAYSAAFAVIGNAELAATLQGTHEAALEQPALAAFTLAASDRALVERCYSKARHLITADEWQRAHARGRSITPEQAVANARRIGDAIMTTHAQQGNGSDAAGESRGVV